MALYNAAGVHYGYDTFKSKATVKWTINKVHLDKAAEATMIVRQFTLWLIVTTVDSGRLLTSMFDA